MNDHDLGLSSWVAQQFPHSHTYMYMYTDTKYILKVILVHVHVYHFKVFKFIVMHTWKYIGFCLNYSCK